ncbi:MAG: hypothetical protein JRI41_02830 [Deltaproteobacteria bacterium]|nr:hypothetical protein [Deltaproteobacteria bacterium]
MKNFANDNCPTVLLDDLPAEHDAFGSHQRIAEAIANLIEIEKGGKSIALIGPWGSGKSTVVKLLEKEFDKNKNITLFTFDAWGHHGDPLRRSFLKQLIRHLRNRKDKTWLTDSKGVNWEKEEAKIDKRFREKTTRYFPRFTRAGIITTACSMFVPIGLALLSHSLWKDRELIFSKKISLVIGVALFLLPLIALGIIWAICKVPCCRRWLLNNGNTNSFALIKGTISEERREEFETPDPTSVEFQDIFIKVLNNALQDPDRKLVIVIDNLDRVSTDEALSLWATMRTFFELSSQGQRPDWLKRLWLLVPFVPDTPERLWQEDVQDSQRTKEVSQQKSIAEEFIDKTFQVKFYVPLPVMSDWKDFFKKQLEEAFPEHFERHQEDFYDLYRVFESKRACRYRPPTPREIKLFINQLGTYHRIWQDEIPLPVQAFYILDVSKRIDAEGAERVLLNKEELIKDVEPIFYRESRLQEYLAALHFNVEPEKAVQVLIGDEVKDALRSGKSERLKKMQEQVEANSFSTVLYNIIAGEWQEWARNEPPVLAKAALALQDLKEDESDEWESIWERIIQGTREAQWANLDKDVGKGIAAVLRRSKDEKVAKDILAHITEPEQPQESETQRNMDVARNWAQGVIEVLYEIHDFNYQDILSKFGILGSAEFYLEVMRSLAESEDERKASLEEYFVPKAEPNEIVQQLTALCQNGNFVDSHADAVHLMLKVKAEWNWNPLIQQIRQKQQNLQVTLPLPELKGYLKTLLFLDQKGTSEANAALQELSQKGHLLHWLNYASKDKEAVGLCLLPIIEHLPSGNASPLPGQAQNGQRLYRQFLVEPPKNIVATLSGLALKFRKGDVFLHKVREEQSIQLLVANVLQEVSEQERIPEFVSCSAIIEHYGMLHDMLQSNVLSEDTLQNIITQLVERSGLIRELMEREFSEDLADLYLRALECSNGGQEVKKFIGYLIKNLPEVSKETWVWELTNEDQLVALIVSLVEKGIQVELSNYFHDGLLEHAKQVLEERTFPSRFAEQWDKVFAALSNDYRWTLLRNLRDELISQGDNSGAKVLELYGNLLLSMHEVLEEKADDAVRLWFTEILERQNPEELAWLERCLKKTETYQKSQNETQRVFSGGIKLAWEKAEDEQVKKNLEAIASSIGLELPESHGEENGDAE